MNTGPTQLGRLRPDAPNADPDWQRHLKQVAPELLAALRRHHETFHGMLQVNLTVLATAHAVSEGIVRGVNAEMQKRNIPQTYTAMGQRAQPGRVNRTPIVVNRTM